MVEKDKIFDEFSKFYQEKYMSSYNDIKEIIPYNYIDCEAMVIDLIRTAFLEFSKENDLELCEELLTVIIIFSSTMLNGFKNK
jgi:hypothetical protein